jgi:hypothetical protein
MGPCIPRPGGTSPKLCGNLAHSLAPAERDNESATIQHEVAERGVLCSKDESLGAPLSQKKVGKEKRITQGEKNSYFLSFFSTKIMIKIIYNKIILF